MLNQRASAGFTLIEVLVTMVVLSIGLLGLAMMQTVSLKYNHNAQLRTQATAFAYDILDRMRVNRNQANAYTSELPNPAPTCNHALSPTGDLAARDLAQWRNLLACQLLDGQGAITINGDMVTVTVCWSERINPDPDPDENPDPDEPVAWPELCTAAGLTGFAYTSQL